VLPPSQRGTFTQKACIDKKIYGSRGWARRGRLGTRYAKLSFSVGGAAVVIEAYAVCARQTERRDVHVADTLGAAAAEGSYEQEAATVEEDEVMERG
jgi:hypothetical protein